MFGASMGTYRGNSTRCRDCAYRPAGLSEGVSEHGDQGLWIKERVKSQLLVQLKERRCGMGYGIETFDSEVWRERDSGSGARKLLVSVESRA